MQFLYNKVSCLPGAYLDCRTRAIKDAQVYTDPGINEL